MFALRRKKRETTMLCTGVVHGDLSEFNILLDEDVPVIHDRPQAVVAAGNNHAKSMLLRNVANLRNFFGGFAPDLLSSHCWTETCALYEQRCLEPRDTVVRPVCAASRARRSGWGHS